MPHDVTQWLAEIRTLQRQLADTQKERDQAYASAANWRKLYEIEARQRRTEVEALKLQVRSQASSLNSSQFNNSLPDTASDLASEQTPDSQGDRNILQAKLRETLALCQTLAQQLEAEKAAHSLTRQTLTTALGDTFDMLKPEQKSSGMVRASQPQKKEFT